MGPGGVVTHEIGVAGVTERPGCTVTLRIAPIFETNTLREPRPSGESSRDRKVQG